MMEMKEKEKVDGPTAALLETEFNEVGEKDPKKDPYAPPDGGWGWVVMICAFTCCLVLDGICYVFGVFMEKMRQDFNVDNATMSMVGSVLSGVIQLVGPFAALLTNILGMRIVCVIGAVVSAAGFFFSTFVNNVVLLMVLFGIVAGTGLGLMYVPAVVSVGYYFDKKRALATGFVCSGSGAGTFILAPLASFLLIQFSNPSIAIENPNNMTVESIETANIVTPEPIETTDIVTPDAWRGAMKVFAGLCLLCTICGLAMRPLPKKPKKTVDEESETQGDGESTANCCKTIINESCSPKLMTNVPFMLLCLANLFSTQGLYIPYVFLPGLAEERGISAVNASFLISIVGICNTICRILSGMLTDLPCVNALVVTVLALGLGGIAPLAMPFCEEYWSFVIVSVMFGSFLSAWCAVTSPVIVDMCDLELLTSGFGTLTFVRGIAALVGPPIAGLLVDLTGKKENAFYLSAALLFLSAIICLGAWVAQKIINKRRTNP